jgi:hypothetical protein
MKYILLIYSDEASYTDQERAECMEESTQLCRELQAKGQLVDASPLHPVAMATSLRIREGKRIVTDGPFAETTEQLGGFYIIDVPDLDAALAVASKLPPAKKGTVEVRPLFELDALTELRRTLSANLT